MEQHRSLPGRYRRRRSLGSHLLRAVLAAVSLTSAAGLVVVGGAGSAQVGEGPGTPVVQGEGRVPDAVQRLMERFDCSAVGYGDGSTPQSALVRRPGRPVRVVTFEEGWEVHTGGGPDVLVAVCLRPAG